MPLEENKTFREFLTGTALENRTAVSQRSKYMALAMKQTPWVLHNHRPDSLLMQAFWPCTARLRDQATEMLFPDPRLRQQRGTIDWLPVLAP